MKRDSQDIVELKTLGTALKVAVRTSYKAKRIGIRINRVNKVELVIPYRGSRAKAYEFLVKKESWIRKKLDEKPVVHNGTFKTIIHKSYPILDKVYHLKHIETDRKLTRVNA